MTKKSQIAESPNNASVEDEVSNNKIIDGGTVSMSMFGGKTIDASTTVGGGAISGNSVDELAKLVNYLKEQIEILQKKDTEQKDIEKEYPKVSTANYTLEEDDEFDKIEIRPDTYVKVMSLCPYQLNLSTKSGGKGKLFSFSTFGTTKRIMYSDLVEILENQERFLKEGYFIILNRAVVRKNGLDEIHAKILTKENIEQILSGNDTPLTISLFKSANKTQQEIIIQMLVDKMIEGQKVDLNLIDKLSRSSGIKIQEKYEDTKSFVDSLHAEKEE
jgi:hypothetical protein